MTIPISKSSNHRVSEWMVRGLNGHVDGVDHVVSGNNDSDMVKAKIEIESRNKNDKKIFIDKDLNLDRQAELREYAIACGVDEEKIVTVSKNNISVSSETVKEDKKTVEAPDPFNSLKSFAKEDSFAKRKMQTKAEPSPKVNSLGKTKGIINRPGGIEEYEGNREINIRSNENSIVEPRNIENTANSNKVSNKDIIRKSNLERKNSIKFDSKEWEAGLTKELADKYVPKSSNVNLTEAAVDFNSNMISNKDHSLFDNEDHFNKIPERTGGEKLSDKAAERRESIQRKANKDDSWNSVKSSSPETISDLFYESLKENMKNG